MFTFVSKLAEEDTEFEELLEARENELHSFQPASKETRADKIGDYRTVQRKLSHMLYLLVKKPRTERPWQMPQGGLEEGENLLEVRVETFCEMFVPLSTYLVRQLSVS